MYTISRDHAGEKVGSLNINPACPQLETTKNSGMCIMNTDKSVNCTEKVEITTGFRARDHHTVHPRGLVVAGQFS
jgi:hypothetical protein